jgi:hypothetical protein
MIQKMGNSFPTQEGVGKDRTTYAGLISDALKLELGGSPNSIGTLLGWTSAHERTAKNWLAGTNGPSGEHLIELMRHSDAALVAIMKAAGRDETFAAIRLLGTRSTVLQMQTELANLLRAMSAGHDN